MKIEQVYALTNEATAQVLGEKAVSIIDATTLVDVGSAIFDSNAVEPYAKALVNVIGRDVFVNRPYSPVAPSVYMDEWLYGSVMRKSQMDMPQATINESWELQAGASYDQNIFYAPTVTVKFFNGKSTFEIPMSITEDQIRQSFRSPEDLAAFVAMIFTGMENAMAVRLQSLTLATVDHFIGATMHDAYPDPESSTPYTGIGNAKCVNLLAMYKEQYPDQEALTPDQCVKDPGFLRFAALQIGITVDRLPVMSTLYNIEGKERHTPRDRMHLLMLSDFARGADIYLQSSTFHDELTRLPDAEKVPFWQGSGDDWSFSSVSKIHTNVEAGNGDNVEVVASGILAVAWDRYALGVTNMNRRTTAHYNNRAQFTNYWMKADMHYFNDYSENFVLWFVA